MRKSRKAEKKRYSRRIKYVQTTHCNQNLFVRLQIYVNYMATIYYGLAFDAARVLSEQMQLLSTELNYS